MIENKLSRRSPINPTERPFSLQGRMSGYTLSPLDNGEFELVAYGTLRNAAGQSEQDVLGDLLLERPKGDSGTITHYNKAGLSYYFDVDGYMVYANSDKWVIDELGKRLDASGFRESQTPKTVATGKDELL